MKKLLLTFLLLGLFWKNNAQIVVTKGTFPTICNGVTTYYNQLTDIIIAETNPADFSTGLCSFEVDAVPFTLLNVGIGQVQFAVNGDITTGSISVCCNYKITINYNCGGTTKLDTIRIKGLQLKTIGGAPASFDYSKLAGGCSINGFVTGQSVMTVNTVNNFANFSLPSSFCPDAAPYQLIGNPTGGTFSGVGVSGGYFYPSLVSANYSTIYYVASNACNSTANNTTVISPGKPSISADKAYLCVGDAVKFTSLGGSSQYSFYKNNILVQGPSTSNTYTTTQFTTGDSIYVKILYGGCNNYSDTISIPVYPKPVVDFTISDYCAVKLPNTFTSVVTIPYGTSTVSNVQWYMDISGTPSTYYPNGNSVNHKFTTPGTHTVRSIVTLSTGCSNLKDTSIFMGDYPHAKFNWLTACGSQTVNLTDSSYIQQAGSSITQWSWDYQNDNIYDQQGIVTTHNYNYNAFGDYFVKLRVKTNYGCKDSIVKKVSLQPTVSPTVTVPYNEPFKLNAGSWTQLGDSSTWNWGAAYGNALGTGSRQFWATGSTNGTYKNGEISYLQSPCINMTGLDKPMISIKLWSKTQNNTAGAMLEASTDGGVNWNFVGKVGLGTNWYNNAGVSGLANIPPAQNHPNNEGWTGMYPDWTVAKISLDKFAGNPTVKFRISFGAVTGNLPRTFGIAVDSVWIGNRTKRVVIEHFTNTLNKPYMTSANTAVDLIRDKRKNDVSAVYYHTSFPDSDPYNLFEPAEPSSKVLYYGVSADPKTVLDGNAYSGSDYSSAGLDTNDVDSRILETAKFDLALSTHLTTSQIQATVRIKYVYPYGTYGAGTPTEPDQDVVLNTIVVEDSASNTVDNILYSSVMRKCLPDAAGSYISKTWQTNDSLTYSFTWVYPTGFISSKLGVVAFLQNHSTKEIFQSVYIKGQGNSGSPVVASIEEKNAESNNVLLYPNPADNEVTILSVSEKEMIANWIIYDNLGKEIKSGNPDKSVKGITIDTNDLSNGIYCIKINLTNTNNTYLKKIIINH